MHVERIKREWLRRHISCESHSSMLSVDGQDIQGNALAEDVDGVLGSGVQVVVVPVVLHNEAGDVDAAVVLVNV